MVALLHGSLPQTEYRDEHASKNPEIRAPRRGQRTSRKVALRGHGREMLREPLRYASIEKEDL